MSLGTLLLFGAANRARQNNPGRSGNPGGVGAMSTGGGGVGSNPGGSDAIILFPALGFPAMVDGTRTTNTLFCLLLTKPDFSRDTTDIENLLKYQAWPSLADSTDLCSFASGSILTPVNCDSVDNVLQAKGKVNLGSIGQGRLREEFLQAYKDKGYDTLVWFSIELPAEVEEDAAHPTMYNLVLPDEDAVLREMIQAIPLPHEGCPRGDDTKTPAGQSVRPLHPFCVFNENYLNVSHLTDLHVACRWDLMQQRIESKSDDHAGKRQYFNNLNERLKEHLRQGKFLFGIEGPDLIGELDAHKVPTELDERLKTQSINLSSEARVKVEKAGNNWSIVDGDKKYFIRRDYQTLNVYEQQNNVHMAIMTGDLVDYNRGHDGTDNNDLDANYAFNRNWTLLYEILAQHYQYPMFTMLGNHDWRLNPYAPVPDFRDQADPVFGLFFLMIFLSGGGTGVFTGLAYSSFKKKETDWTWAGVGFLNLGLLWTFGMVTSVVAILDAWTGAAGTEVLLDALWSIWLWVAMALSAVLGGSTAGLLVATDEQIGDDLGNGALFGTLLGTSMGMGVGCLALIALAILADKQMKEVPPYVFLTEEETESVIKEDFHTTALVGANGTMRTTELALRWYSLVINPFVDYYFRFKDMAFVMLDWNRGESLLQGMPPLASWALSQEQWELVQRWSLNTSAGTAALLGMHATVFTPDGDVDMSELQSDGMKWDDGKLDRSSFKSHRSDLIQTIKNMAGQTASALSLSGHTHLNDVFQFKDQEKIIRITHDAQGQIMGLQSDKACYIVTSCADPRGSREDSTMEECRPVRREIKFGTDGHITDITVKKLTPPPDLRSSV